MIAHQVIALPIATVLSVQNTQRFAQAHAVSAELIEDQITHLARDISFVAIKIGLLGNVAQVEMLARVLARYRHLPIILDPIIRASTDDTVINTATLQAIKHKLLALCTCITPNMFELIHLSGESQRDKAIAGLDVPWILVTDGDSTDDIVDHQLYHHGILAQNFICHKLPHSFHGSGCTLSSSLCAHLARGERIAKACQYALDWTYQTLSKAGKIGQAQYHPYRGA